MGINPTDNLCPVCKRFPLIDIEIKKDSKTEKKKVCKGNETYKCAKIPALCRCPRNPAEQVDQLAREN
jgi:hypothetical protein